MIIAKRKQVDLLQQLKRLVAGLEQHMTGDTLMLGGRTWKLAELRRFIRDHIDGRVAAEKMHRDWITTTTNLRDEFAQSVEPVVISIHHHLVAQYGEDHEKLGAFGFAPVKKRYTSAETKKVAAEKSRATRKARGTLGKRQRLAIKGVVPPSEPAED